MEIGEEGGQPVGLLNALRAELDEMRRRVDHSDKKIYHLDEVETARNKRKWYQESNTLVATLSLILSLVAIGLGQFNIKSDRKIQDRDRLSALIDQLPTAAAQAHANSGFSVDHLGLVAANAAILIDKLGPEVSTAGEKIEVAGALAEGFDLLTAKRLATMAKQQSTDLSQKEGYSKPLRARSSELFDIGFITARRVD